MALLSAPDSAGATGITVVVPTRNRPEFIDQIVSSVLACEYPDFRVIVIDQSDNDHTGVIVRRLAEQHPNLRYIRQAGTGLSRSRNLGVAESTDPLIAFVDDDCTVPRDWLTKIAAHFDRLPELALMYGQVVRPPDIEIGENHLPLLLFDEPRLRRPDQPFELFGMGANHSVRRASFCELGGFDDLLGVGACLRAGEDFDYQYRVYLAGGTIGNFPDVTVDHYGVRNPAQWPRTLRDYGYGDAAFYLKHARSGDLRALGWLIQRGLKVAVREALLQLGIRKRPAWAPYLAGFLAGIPGSLRVGVDRQKRLYRA